MRRNGFTLIELMITIVIISIVMAIAIPRYREVVERGERNQAMADLEAAAQAMERYRMVQFRYNDATAGAAQSDTISDRSPRSGSKRYNIRFGSSTDPLKNSQNTTFRIDAVRLDGMEALSIDNEGRRCIKAGGSSCTFGVDRSWGDSGS